MVATVLFPFSTTVTGNCINRPITPDRTRHILWPMSGTFAWRNGRNSTACSNGSMAWLGVLGTVTADEIDLFFAWNLVKQLGRCCINRARSVDVYAQRSRGQPPIKSDSRVTA
ncbi:MAG: hypothetical protein E5299_01935 [Burkholderia gladioli]|nr:MAG: hypothetical protein E5299_01935 [Burkholderia gladioli]